MLCSASSVSGSEASEASEASRGVERLWGMWWLPWRAVVVSCHVCFQMSTMSVVGSRCSSMQASSNSMHALFVAAVNCHDLRMQLW